MSYVNNGGHPVLGQRSGMKNVDNGLQAERQPGPLVPLLGGRVEQYYALIDPVPIDGQFGDNTSKLWAELLSTNSPDTQVLATYGKSNGWLDGKPAIITRKVGKGSITYVGVWMDEAGMAKLATWMIQMSGVNPALSGVPASVEVDPRYGEDHTVFVLINWAPTPQTVTLPATMQNVLEGGSVESVTLPQYGVSVLSEAKQ
jgi:beta-galactosidase